MLRKLTLAIAATLFLAGCSAGNAVGPNYSDEELGEGEYNEGGILPGQDTRPSVQITTDGSDSAPVAS